MTEGIVTSRGGVKVWEDYRNNIIVDKKNTILRWKAEKDKYASSLFPPEVQERFLHGIARIGSLHSEDALTWNVFRSLYQANKLHLITDFLSPNMEASTLYFWGGHSLEKSSAEIDSTVQGALNEIEPWGEDGRRQQTETDVMLRGRVDLVMVECKLGLPGKPVKAWIRSRSGMRDDYRKFIEKSSQRLFNDSFDFKSDGNRFCQLFRNYLLGAALSQRWRIQFWMLAIVNSKNTNLGGLPHETEFEYFRSKLVDPSNAVIITWQQVMDAVKEESQLGKLRSYLENHTLL